MAAAEHAGATLTIDLAAVAANWRLLREHLTVGECGAVIKADAYGLGVAPVARTLLATGCRSFFVATADEGLELRGILPNATIFVLHGVRPEEERPFAEAQLAPVLNTPDELARWSALARSRGEKLPAALQLDTGMSRLGFEAVDAARLVDDPSPLATLELRCVMSHLACSDERDNPLNSLQLASFEAMRRRMPTAPASIANSSAIFLGSAFHLDLVRPGAAIFGIAPFAHEPNPLRQVVELQAQILQVRLIDSSRTVGYGATHRAGAPTRVATVAVGYADGYLRSLSNRGSAFLGGVRVPVVGRVSMDLITLDVTRVPEHLSRPGATVELLGPNHTADDLAREAGTIGYEILTSLGRRYFRAYLGGD
jgi:alanine racemase